MYYVTRMRMWKEARMRVYGAPRSRGSAPVGCCPTIASVKTVLTCILDENCGNSYGVSLCCRSLSYLPDFLSSGGSSLQLAMQSFLMSKLHACFNCRGAIIDT